MRRTSRIKLTNPTACIAEGNADRAILDVLLDNERAIFTRNQLLDEEVLPRTSARSFEDNYLGKAFDEPITVIRVIDSRRENFPLRAGYKDKIKLITVITAPEIEILVIIAENAYKDYLKTKLKPSEYCKVKLGLKDIKPYDFAYEYFQDIHRLIETIKEYKRLKSTPKNEYTLYDLAKV